MIYRVDRKRSITRLLASSELREVQVIHRIHDDWFPVCWFVNKFGPYVGADNDMEVTCPDCINIDIEMKLEMGKT